MTTPTREQLIKVVEASPEAVAIHDKAAWMSIFAQYHVVEDPVGSKPHVGGLYDGKSGVRGHGALSRFYDTFIAPNTINFAVDQDLVLNNHVVRDLTINLEMSDSVHAQVPMHLLYELVEEDGQWKILRLGAHWEMVPMVTQLLGKGIAAVPVLSALTWRMLKLQGLSGTLGFSKAAFSIGKKGKQSLENFAQAVNEKSLAKLMACFDSDDENILLQSAQEKVSPSVLLDNFTGSLELSKIIASGDTVSATITLTDGEENSQGVILAQCNRKTKKIHALTMYLNH